MLKRWSVVLTFNGDVKRLLGSMALVSFAYVGVMGVLLNLYLLRLGFDIEYLGLLLASGPLLWGIASLPAGAIGQRIGLRNAMMLGFATVSVAFALLLLVETLPQRAWAPWIFVFYVMCWIFSALFTVNMPPFMMSAATAVERNHAFASQSALSVTCGFLGGLIGGLLPGVYVNVFGGSLDSPAPFRTVLWLVSICYITATLVMSGATSFRLPGRGTQQGQADAPLGSFILLGSIVALLAIGGGAPRAFFNVYLDTELAVPASQIGAIMGFAQFLPIVVALLTPQLLDRFGSAHTLMAMGAALAVALVVLGAATNWFVAALGFAANMGIVAVVITSQNVFSQELVAERWRSMSSAVINMGLSMGWSLSAAMGGLLVASLGFRGYFFLCAAIVLVASVILVVYHYRQRGRGHSPQPVVSE